MIRRIRPDDVYRYRDVRLRALEDAPAAFATTLAEANRIPAERWHDRARKAADGPDATMYFAVDSEGGFEGMVAARRSTTASTTAELISMWVAPQARRSGTGADLVHCVIDWAAESGYQRLELWVARGNDPAERLYRTLGFTDTGDVQPLPSDPCKDELRMRLDLGAQIS